jgi:opacity protein-like surface antigen
MMKIVTALLSTALGVGLVFANASVFAAGLPTGVVTATAPTPSAATENFYASVFGGAAFGSTLDGHLTLYSIQVGMPLNTGYLIGGSIGLQVSPNLRGELELSYSSRPVAGTLDISGDGNDPHAEVDSGSFGALYVLGNLWYDFNTAGSLTPYLGGGLGVATLFPDISAGQDGTNFVDPSVALAGQLGGGIRSRVSESLSLDIGYRAKGVVNGSLASPNLTLAELQYIDHTVQLGLDFAF